jgi:hypothetical protein
LVALLPGLQVASIHGFLSASPPAKPQQKGDAEMDKPTPKINQSHSVNSAFIIAQRQRLLIALREAGNHGLTTILIRAAARVHELRWDYGHNIQVIPAQDKNAQGNRHACKSYVMFPGEWPKLRRAA